MNETLTGREFQNKYMLWALIALELFMSFSFLGYIHIDPISITFVYIPVLAAGCLMGPKESTLVGAIFGLASMWKASAFYVGAGDMIFSPIQSGRPLERQMERLKEEMNAIRLSKGGVTCSVGVIPVEGGAAIDELYRRADRLLYEAKQKGKDQFVLSGRKDIC